jgi:hypothetical protein
VQRPALVLVAYFTTKAQEVGFFRTGVKPHFLEAYATSPHIYNRSYSHSSYSYGALLTCLKKRLRERFMSLQKRTCRRPNTSVEHPNGLLQLHGQTKKEQFMTLVDHMVLRM